jgi:hypothetical protein
MNPHSEDLKTLGFMLIVVAVFVVVPLVIVFTEHQRKMMKLLRGVNDEEPSLLKRLWTANATDKTEIEDLRRRVAILESDVASLRSLPRPEVAGETLKSRLG